MKKIITGLTVVALMSTTAFAKSADPNPNVLHAFQAEFKNATNVVWQERPDFAKVHFNFLMARRWRHTMNSMVS